MTEMEFLLQTLHGPYTYLIVFQVLVISVLMLLLLWFMVKRTLRREALAGAGNDLLSFSPPVSPVHAEPVPQKVLKEEKEPMPAAEQTAPAETIPVASQNTPDNQALLEKVQYLETKLLEYEILQDEIGTLKKLKKENEELRSKVQSLSAKSVEAKKEKKDSRKANTVAREPQLSGDSAHTDVFEKEPLVELATPIDEKILEPKPVAAPVAKTPKKEVETPAKASTPVTPASAAAKAPGSAPKAEKPKSATAAKPQAEGDGTSAVLAGILDQLEELSKEDEKKKTGS